MTTVLACLDDSLAAERVAAAALAVAPAFGADVRAVHVSDGRDATAEGVAAHHALTLTTSGGDPVEALVAAAGDPDVVAMVVGAHRHTTGPRPAGHVVWALAERIDVPLLVVPPGVRPASTVRRVLVAMKGTPASAVRLRHTVELATAAQLEVVAVHVDDESTVPSFSDQPLYDTETYAREFLDRYVPGTTPSRLELRVGDPADEVLRVAAAEGVEVVAAGFTAPAGDVVRTLVERSTVPVLLVSVHRGPAH